MTCLPQNNVVRVTSAALKVYHKSLANVDWLHGSAESMLTITNLLIGTAVLRLCKSPCLLDAFEYWLLQQPAPNL